MRYGLAAGLSTHCEGPNLACAQRAHSTQRLFLSSPWPVCGARGPSAGAPWSCMVKGFGDAPPAPPNLLQESARSTFQARRLAGHAHTATRGTDCLVPFAHQAWLPRRCKTLSSAVNSAPPCKAFNLTPAVLRECFPFLEVRTAARLGVLGNRRAAAYDWPQAALRGEGRGMQRCS